MGHRTHTGIHLGGAASLGEVGAKDGQDLSVFLKEHPRCCAEDDLYGSEGRSRVTRHKTASDVQARDDGDLDQGGSSGGGGRSMQTLDRF